MTTDNDKWYLVENAGEIPSPALIVYPNRVEENIKSMIAIAGGEPGRLRPHVKTHKMAEVVKLQMKYGIQKFKCSTIAEVELVARCGAKDILLAIQPVGPAIKRLSELRNLYPDSKFSAIADSENIVREINENCKATGYVLNLWLDVNIGMNRTGIIPGTEALSLYSLIAQSDSLQIAGLHVYDGHNHEPDSIKRFEIFNNCIDKLNNFTSEIVKAGHGFPAIIAGGTPTFPYFAKYDNMELSPGTTIFWDQGYSESFSEMPFVHAAVLMMRLISKPSENLMCFDLGTKAIASEMPHPRIKIFGLNNYVIKSHYEEHFVIESTEAGKFKPGDIFYGIPYHICPTVARYESVSVVKNNKFSDTWQVEARNRKLTI